MLKSYHFEKKNDGKNTNKQYKGQNEKEMTGIEKRKEKKRVESKNYLKENLNKKNKIYIFKWQSEYCSLTVDATQIYIYTL